MSQSTNNEDFLLEKVPDMKLAYCEFLLSFPENANNHSLQRTLMEGIKKNKMSAWYQFVSSNLGWKFDSKLYNEMQLLNEESLKKFDKIYNKTINLGETEVTILNLNKAIFYSSIGDKEKAVNCFWQVFNQIVSPSKKINIIFHLLRIGFFFMDYSLIANNLEIGNKLVQENGNFDAKNKLKVYEALYCIIIRNFKKASSLLIDSINSFAAYELIDYKTFVYYTIYTSIITLPRDEFFERVLKNSNISEVIFLDLTLKKQLLSFFIYSFNEIFPNLSTIETYLKHDYFFYPHCNFYIQEMKICIYSQILTSYRSLSLEYVANILGVTDQFVETDISKFIALGRLQCKINKVKGLVETYPPDFKKSFKSVISQGDLLLTKIQRLCRIISI